MTTAYQGPRAVLAEAGIEPPRVDELIAVGIAWPSAKFGA